MNSNYLRVIVPTPLQAISSLLVSVLLLAAVFRNHLIDVITGSSGVNPSELGLSYHDNLTKLTHIGFMPELTIGVFWAGVAVVGYILIIDLANLVIGLRNEVVVDTSFLNAGPATARVARLLIRFGIAIVFFLYLLVAAKLLLPVWTDLAGQAVLGQITVGSIVSAAGGAGTGRHRLRRLATGDHA